MGRRMLGAMTVGLAGVMVLGACGSDDKALSKAEYIAKGDALCKSFDAQVSLLFDKVFAESSEMDMAVAKAEMPRIAESAEKFEADFTALEGPEADAAAINKINAGVEKLSDTFATAADHAKAGDEEKFESTFLENLERFEEVDKRSVDYGFKECGSAGAGDDYDDDKGDTSSPGVPLSPGQQAFVRQGDEICRATDELLETPFVAVGSGTLPEAATALKETILPAQREQVAKLRALTPPPGDEARIKQLIDGLDALDPLDRKLLAAAEAGDDAAYDAAFADVTRAAVRIGKRFEDYGFEECG